MKLVCATTFVTLLLATARAESTQSDTNLTPGTASHNHESNWDSYPRNEWEVEEAAEEGTIVFPQDILDAMEQDQALGGVEEEEDDDDSAGDDAMSSDPFEASQGQGHPAPNTPIYPEDALDAMEQEGAFDDDYVDDEVEEEGGDSAVNDAFFASHGQGHASPNTPQSWPAPRDDDDDVAPISGSFPSSHNTPISWPAPRDDDFDGSSDRSEIDDDDDDSFSSDSQDIDDDQFSFSSRPIAFNDSPPTSTKAAIRPGGIVAIVTALLVMFVLGSLFGCFLMKYYWGHHANQNIDEHPQDQRISFTAQPSRRGSIPVSQLDEDEEQPKRFSVIV